MHIARKRYVANTTSFHVFVSPAQNFVHLNSKDSSDTRNSFPTIVTQDTRKWTKLWARFGWRALFTSHAQQLTVLIRNYQFPLTFRDPVQDRCCPQFFSSLLSSFHPLALLTHPFLSWLQPPCSLLLPFIFFPFSFYGLCTTGCGKLRIDTLHTK